MADMQQHAGEQRIILLRLSTLGFVTITGVSAFVYFSLVIASSSSLPFTMTDLSVMIGNFALPALPGAFLSWWVVVVVPKRPSSLTGGCAGLLTIIFAVLGVCVTWFMFGHLLPTATPFPRYTPGQDIEIVFFYWIYGLIFLGIQPWGRGIFLVGILVGALYGALVHRIFSPPA
jgi:hypothetical protein